MKTLKNHMILFDGECPMCSMYTSAFVKSGMMADNGRASYQHIPEACPVIDQQRGVNEIALVNLQNGEVTYGIKSLFKIIGNACPIFKSLFAFNPFVWLMSKVYAFISYNRRVIIPTVVAGDGYAYQPTFKKHYRIAYLLFTWFCTGYILTAYAHLLIGIVPLGNPLREYMICGGQIIFQGLVISTYAKDKLWSYLGNMMTISFAGSLLLLIMLGINHLFKISPVVAVIYFMAVAGLMFLEHIRRSKLLNIGWRMTISWAFYRAMLLVVILVVK
jgi:predicted DCC family thiol-disulfide oxidoreductase YuxK